MGTYVCNPQSILPILLSRFSGIAWPLIGSAIISAKGDYIYGFPLLSLPENTLFAWCHAHPEHAPAFAARHVPFLDSGESGALSVHPVMVRLLEEFGDRRDVIEVSRCHMCSGLSIGSKEGGLHISLPKTKVMPVCKCPQQPLMLDHHLGLLR